MSLICETSGIASFEFVKLIEWKSKRKSSTISYPDALSFVISFSENIPTEKNPSLVFIELIRLFFTELIPEIEPGPKIKYLLT